MENLYIQPTKKTPTINFDGVNGKFEILGISVPEHAIEFYTPIKEYLEKYSKNPQPKTQFTFNLEYFNTSSSKAFFDIIKDLEKIKNSGSDVEVFWHYEEFDEDMLEAGQDYQSMVSVTFHIIQCDSE
jgi:hypothetical protein